MTCFSLLSFSKKVKRKNTWRLGVLFLSDDNGQTWSCQDYWGDESRTAYWHFSAFDNEHPDTKSLYPVDQHLQGVNGF